jgi:DNA-binding MarR family transcriptional regulator
MAGLTDRQRTILTMIDEGCGRLDYLIDRFSVDSTHLNRDIEHLEEEGYLSRLGGAGYAFFSFMLLPRGAAELPPAPDAQLRREGLTLARLRIIRHVNEHPGCRFWDLVDGTGLAEGVVLSSVNHLIYETGYLQDGGFWRRTLWTTPRGRQALEKHGSAILA